ncbi:MBL fold metallo-hydrolase [Actinomycetaceae bacterium TAE3-ERU4]|nr:MBL fold metallo-hydrolase [Actinomycetaceae bacterium TAE3-ERU4]
MRIDRIVAPLFSANCFVLSHEGKAVVIDPGAGSYEPVTELLEELGAELTAVLITHGHADHLWDAGKFAAPLFIAHPDEYRLSDPVNTTAGRRLPLGPALEPYLPWTPPPQVRNFAPDFFTTGMSFAPGIVLRGMNLPGHTEGLVVIMLGGGITDNISVFSADPTFGRNLKENDTLVFTGDLIFSNSVGRSDLPGGNEKQMRHSLRSFANSFPPDCVLLPGHGPVTTHERELKENLHLRQARKIG